MSANSDGDRPRIYLLIENRTKSNNLGSILRCASAFGITTIVAIGFSKCDVKGSHGANKHVSIIAFPVIEKAEHFIRHELRCKSIIGLLGSIPNEYAEVKCAANEGETRLNFADETNRLSTRCMSIPLQEALFVNGNTCFAIDKERHGLPLSIGQICDLVIHIPHLPISGPNTLLNTPTCLSLVLDAFMRCICYAESSFHGHKFVVAPNHGRNKGESKDDKPNEADVKQHGGTVTEDCSDVNLNAALGNMLSGDY